MARTRGRAYADWETPQGNEFLWQHVQVEVLMDIREQLVALNATLSCFRVRRMSDDINRIDRRLQNSGVLAKKRRKKAARV